MDGYAFEELKKCCDVFQEMLLDNQYINLKKFNKFLDTYSDVLSLSSKLDFENNDELKLKVFSIVNNGYEIIEKRNQKFIGKKLEEYKEYFDNMFLNVDPNIKLDNEQRKAILIDDDYSLIAAGAGSGKSITICAKVKYLVEKCGVDSSKILILSFTKSATKELEEIVNNSFNLNIEILTFYNLGMKIVKKLINNPINIVNDTKVYDYIVNYVRNYIFKDKFELKKIMKYFNEYVTFDNSVFDYDNFNDYFKHYIEVKYDENKNNLKSYLTPKILNRVKLCRGIDGNFYKSKGEVIIANFLYENNIDFEYKRKIMIDFDDNSFLPDFSLNINGEKLYIEYFGLTNYQDEGKYTLDDIRTYHSLVEKRDFLHEKYGFDLIELYSSYDDGRSIINVLITELSKRNIILNKKSDEEIFYKFMSTSQEIHYYKFINLCLAFIKKFKEQSSVGFEQLIKEQKSKKIKCQLEVMRNIFRFYDKCIHDNYQMDISDMINMAYVGLDKLDLDDDLNYEYLVIDEYQDISLQKYNLSKKLSDLCSSKMVAVGDDWQSIYGFSGADIDLFTNFIDLMGYGKISKITKSYRNSQELLNVASSFVSKNVEQFDKKLCSTKHEKKPVEICYYSSEDTCVKILEKILAKNYVKDANLKILLLGRYSTDINLYLDSNHFYRGVENRIICKKFPSLKIDFMTIKKSKGLEYDQVIILNTKNSRYGFPSQIVNDKILQILEKYNDVNVEFPYERKMFYVALTRTKNKVYLITPYAPIFRRSDFVFEIKNNPNVLENFDYIKK